MIKRTTIFLFAIIILFCNIQSGQAKTTIITENTIPTVQVSAELYNRPLLTPPDSYGKALLQAYDNKNCGDLKLDICIQPDVQMQSCMLSVTYNPQVLEYTGRGIVTMNNKLTSIVTPETDGKLLIDVAYDGGSNFYTDSLCFNILKNGDALLKVDLLSYEDRNGMRTDAKLFTDIPFSQIETVNPYGEDLNVKESLWVHMATAAVSYYEKEGIWPTAKEAFFLWIKDLFCR